MAVIAWGLASATQAELIEAAGPQVPGASSDERPGYQTKAVEAIRQGNTEQALALIKRELAGDPTAGPAEVVLATLLQDEGRTDAARMTLEQAVVAYPDDPEPYLAFGDLAWRQRRLTDAHLQYQRGRELAGQLPADDPRKRNLETWALAGLGSVAETRREFEKALTLFNELLEKDSQHPQAHFRMANVLFALGREEESHQHFVEARKLMEGAPPATLMMAGLSQRSGDLDKAEQWLRRAVEAAPDEAAPRLNLARFLLDVRNDADAAERVLQEAPNTKEARQLSALVAWRRGNLERAERLLEPLAIESPNDPMLNAYLTSILVERGGEARLQRAQELATLNASMHPSSVVAAATYGWTALHLGDTELALRQLEKALEADASNRDARYYLARALFRSGRATAAKEQLHLALSAPGPFIHLRDAQQWGRQIGLESADR